MHNTGKSFFDHVQPPAEVVGFAPLKPAEFMRYNGAILQGNVGLLPINGVGRK